MKESIRKGRYRIRSRLYDPNNDGISPLSFRDKHAGFVKPTSNNQKSNFNLEKKFEQDPDIPFKREILTNEEFQTKVLELLEDIRSLSLDNFVQNYLLLSDKLAKYFN